MFSQCKQQMAHSSMALYGHVKCVVTRWTLLSKSREMLHCRDDDAETPDRCGKSIPDWARSHNLLEALKKQQYVDPDKIFKAKNNTCALDDVFVDSGKWDKRKCGRGGMLV